MSSGSTVTPVCQYFVNLSSIFIKQVRFVVTSFHLNLLSHVCVCSGVYVNLSDKADDAEDDAVDNDG